MSEPWEDKKTHSIGKYVVYSVRGGKYEPRRWYTEIHAITRHGLLYRSSYGSNAPTRLLAIVSSLIRYIVEQP